MSFCAVNDKQENSLMVIWDLGRRCTFSCSYCPPHRKNNWSKTASLEELIETAKGLERYHTIYNNKRKNPFKLSASFTGGEPTANPSFFKFLEYLQEHYPHWKRTLTSNGFYSERKLRIVMAKTDFTTVSWHCEATPKQKDRVKQNIQIMHDEGYGFKVNVMFHAHDEYFDECVSLCEWLDERNIKYTPRIIGDEGNVKVGIAARTVHEYTEPQLAWMRTYWDSKKKPKKVVSPPPNALGMMIATDKPKKIVGQTIGRPCCGGRPMEILSESTGEWERSNLIPDTNFQGWNCMINWYFLYIHQEVGEIWHHQTCQVNLEGEVAPITSIKNFDKYCDKLEDDFANDSFPMIKCPKTHCGCGLCVPKAKHQDTALEIFKSQTNITPVFYDAIKPIENPQTLKTVVYAFDAANGNETI